jgi:hypothetical protein
MNEIAKLFDLYEPVGSRRTCVPAPLSTDDDYLAYAHGKRYNNAVDTLINLGYEHNGGDYSNSVLDDSSEFVSFKRGEHNIILTDELEFYDRFMAATSVAKRLNLLKKEDRVALFQAVLYGNPCEV